MPTKPLSSATKPIHTQDENSADGADLLAQTRAELADLRAEYDDLKLLYDATMTHGETIENELAEANILLQRTQARLNEELDDASRYARSILPAPREEWPRTDWYFEPSTELGGDAFGYHHVDPDHFAIYLIDVCGHGVGAALLAATAINVLRTEAMSGPDFRDASAVLSALNDTFPMEKQANMFFTMWYGVHNKRTGELRYACAGHPPAILIHSESEGEPSPTLLGHRGNLAIGTFPDLQYSEDVATVHPSDQLLVFSDGAYEVETGRSPGDMLTVQDLVDYVMADLGRGPDEVYRWIKEQNGEGALPDDFSLVRVHF